MKEKDISDVIISLVRNNPLYEEYLLRILEYEEQHCMAGNQLIEYHNSQHGTNFDTYWEWSNVRVAAQSLNQMLLKGVTTIIYKSRSTTNYCLTDRVKTREALEGLAVKEKIEEVIPAKIAEIPQDIFAPVVGYKDLLWAFKKSLQKVRTNILLCGPPATGKSVILYEVGRLPDADYILGHRSSKSGLTEELFDKRPRYLLIDELSRIKEDAEGALLSLMELGLVKTTLHNDHREMHLDCNVYAATNRLKGLSEELLSRFEIFRLKPYTREEFVEVCRRVLVLRENTDEDVALHIASSIIMLGIERDPRVAIRTARICDDKSEVNKYLKVVKKYS